MRVALLHTDKGAPRTAPGCAYVRSGDAGKGDLIHLARDAVGDEEAGAVRAWEVHGQKVYPALVSAALMSAAA